MTDLRSKKYSLLEALLIGLVTFLVCFYELFYPVDNLLKDITYQNYRGINNKIKIIAIDDKTLQALGPFGTWSRDTYAEVINKLGDYPAVIGIDIMLFGEMTSDGDKALYNACLNNGKVVVGSNISFSTEIEKDREGKEFINHMHISNVQYSYLDGAAISGFVNASTDNDGKMRTALLSLDNNGEQLKSFSSQVYEVYCRNIGVTPNIPNLDDYNRMWISYAGRPYEYEYVSLIDVLNNDPSANPKIYNDCIVIIGAYAEGLQDQFSVPKSHNLMNGVEIHANIIQSIMDGCYPVPASKTTVSIVTALIAMLMYFIFKKCPIRLASVLLIFSIAAYVITGILLYSKANIIIPVLYAPVFIFLAYLVALIKEFIMEKIEKRKLATVFKKYVAPQVVDDIIKKGHYNLVLGGENRHIAVLFVDIRGFTPLSESLEPEQVVEILNSYLNLTTNSIFKNNGTLDKFIGDATMAVFNAPFDLDDYIFKACCAAWDMLQGANKLEDELMQKYGKSVSFGIGINCGNAVVGNIGCDFRMDYTAIGDTVNTSARLESNAKRGQILISDAVYEAVKDRVTVEEVGEIPLKGKSKGVFVYSLTGIDRQEEDK